VVDVGSSPQTGLEVAFCTGFWHQSGTEFGTETALSRSPVSCNIKHLKATNPGFLFWAPNPAAAGFFCVKSRKPQQNCNWITMRRSADAQSCGGCWCPPELV